jgi:hypothetical protein
LEFGTVGGIIGPIGAESCVKPEQIERLRQNEGKVVKITCTDGELLEAKIIHVDDESRDAIYDLVSSSTPEKYNQGTASAYVIQWDDIADFQ